MRKTQYIDIYSKVEPGKVLASVCRNSQGDRVNLTPEDEILQAAYVNLKKNVKIKPHWHQKTKRTTIGTSEAWVVIKGKAKVSFYDLDNRLISSTKITKGQIVILFEGGHALESKSRFFSIIEIKNGPYLGKKLDSIQIR